MQYPSPKHKIFDYLHTFYLIILSYIYACATSGPGALQQFWTKRESPVDEGSLTAVSQHSLGVERDLANLHVTAGQHWNIPWQPQATGSWQYQSGHLR